MIKESGTLTVSNENLTEEFAQALGLSQEEEADLQKRIAIKIKNGEKLFEVSCGRDGYDIFISIAIDKKPFKASWKKIPSGTGWRYFKEKPDSYIDRIDDTYYAIATSKEGLRSIKSTISFNQSVSRFVWCRVQFKKDLWLSVCIDIGYIKFEILQGKKLNIKNLDKSWIDKMDVEVSFVVGDKNALHSHDTEELKIVSIIASDKISKILKVLGYI